jgi:hypothetical protein
MFIKAKDSVTGITRYSLFVIFSMIFCSTVAAQDACPVYPTMRGKKVPNITIPGTDLIHGYLEQLPDDYYSSPTKKFPLFIFFHGANEGGPGTSETLCRLVGGLWWWAPPVLVELNKWPHYATDQTGKKHSFILISPQMEYFGDPSNTINKLLDYLSARYRVDASRIYLTGLSAGAHYVDDYVGSSQANAKRIAAVAPVSPCSGINSQQASTISNAGLHLWAFKCLQDDCGGGQVGNQIVNSINAVNPSANLAVVTNLGPQQAVACNSYTHDTWGTAYDSAFRQNVNGRNVSMYDWMLGFTNGTTAGPLPVTLKDFTARLSDGKVYLRWTTDAEVNSKRFGIERAGASQQFIEVAGIPAAGISTGGKTYEWVDDKPLANLSFYRLSQTDIDGEKQYFPIRKILNRVKWDRSAIVSPNPFTTDLSVYLNVEKAQRVTISLNDMNGKRLKVVYGMYKEGAAEVNVAAGNLPRGVYLLKIEGESFSETQKVLKQ